VILHLVSEENPWLRVPLADYEGHMRAPGVEQLDVLAELFGRVLTTCAPHSVAILGVAGGNGLDFVHPSLVRRVVGIDINPAYIDETARRYADLPLELHCADLATDDLGGIEPVDLVHAALIFEHAGTDGCVETAVRLLRPDGYLSLVLQLPSATTAEVSPSGFDSIQLLRDDFSLVDRDVLVQRLCDQNLRLVDESTRMTGGSKTLWLGVFNFFPAS